MDNPIQIYNELRETYLKYITSGIPFFNEHYNAERKKLLNEVGTICQPPIIEIVPQYKQLASLEQFCETEQVSSELAEFIQCGLFYNDKQEKRILYKHQYHALKEAFINRKHIVVTTGTGSGKTECFLLPVIADLVKESKSWSNNRTRAMRTMILYPLNALAEDQMIRLRKSLNSRNDDHTGTLDWLDDNRNGSRFYFGRYTGTTPVSGSGSKAREKIQKEQFQLNEEWKAAQQVAQETGSKDLLYHIPCLDEDSAEMWDRLSMQEQAPDIVITNYSMLNIMLMRDLEAPIFEETKQWLEEDESHVFHLVIDELHTYRGTAGTEVAYLIRILLDRLGLTPDSPQVQFLASSASMGENQQTADFLCEFFGVAKDTFEHKFKVFANDKEMVTPKPETVLPIDALVDYINVDKDEEHKTSELFKTLGCESYYQITKEYKLDAWLKYAMTNKEGNITSMSTLDIAHNLGLIGPRAVDVLTALLKVICRSKTDKGYLLPLRTHFFFRSVNGLWGCSNPNCSELDSTYKFTDRLLGRFYKSPRSMCACGHNVYEVIICENCGEAYFGGYVVKKDGRHFLSVDKPIDMPYCDYAVIWKAEGDCPDGWQRAKFISETGRIIFNHPAGEYLVHKQQSRDATRFPCTCPQCEVKYPARDANSFTPLKRHATGLQKVNQVLADSLVRSMKNAGESNTKVVLFSDSRQAAAKLSAGVELDHYRDALRWLMHQALKGDNDTISFLRKYKQVGKLADSKEDRDELKKLRGQGLYVKLVELILDRAYNLSEEEEAEVANLFAKIEHVDLEKIKMEVFKGLVGIGLNPAGPRPSMANDVMVGKWSTIFDFEKKQARLDLQGDAKVYSDKIRLWHNLELITSLFAHKKKSFESMKLGFMCCNEDGMDSITYQLVNSIIRVLGEKRRIRGANSEYLYSSFPNSVRRMINVIYNKPGRVQVSKKVDEIKSLMINKGIIDKDEVILTGEKINFKKATPGMKYWVCPRCKTVHIQPSNGFCINCQNELGNSKILTDADFYDSEDYYFSLVNSTEKIYRLHCEEMSGQTSRQESRKRQRLFQDIFLSNENPIVDGIDMLSVTTTMEAGVDIGSLSAVIMGNVPPQRFNYQQRVGRAGRRGNPLSVALTIAKGSSHDITHYFEPDRMVSATPKDPYLEVRIKEIAERVIYKEVLYHAMKSVNTKAESVHGSFGFVSNWDKKNKHEVAKWISKNHLIIHHVIDIVTQCTDISEEDKSAIFDYVLNRFIDRISEIANSSEFTQTLLSERLANAGLLPMFGFPTRTRNLYLSKPKQLPAEDVVNRDMDMALNSFSPGHEIVKDKKIYKAVGVVEYESNKQPTPKYDSLNISNKPLFRCKKCGFSSMSLDEKSKICPVCESELYKMKVCSPLGFCVDFNQEPKDFNGSFDWYSPNSDIKLDCEKDLHPCPLVSNLQLRNNTIPTQGLVHLVNDNNGAFYEMGFDPETKIWVSRKAYPLDIQKKLRLNNEQKLAFVSSKATGVLTMSPHQVSPEICLYPLAENKNYYAVQAAFLSWGYLVRKAVANYLDIDISEMSVGYYISSETNKAEMFLVEKLENGSGYCNYLSGRKYGEVPFEAIVRPLIEGGSLYNLLTGKEHMHDCTSSCYDCIREFANQREHPILDWRLGLDVAKMVADSNVIINFTEDYWKSYIDENIELLFKKQHLQCRVQNNLYLGIDGGEISALLVHPLWSTEYIESLLAKNSFPSDINLISIYDIGRAL